MDITSTNARITTTTRCPEFVGNYLARIPADLIEGLPDGYRVEWRIFRWRHRTWHDPNGQWVWGDSIKVTTADGEWFGGCDGLGADNLYYRKADLLRALGDVCRITVCTDGIVHFSLDA